MDVQPVYGRGLGAADLLANFGMEDLSTSAGQAAQPGLDERFENIVHGPAGDLAKPLDLHGRIGLDVNLGGGFSDPAHDVEVIFEGQLVMEPADDVQLGRAACAGLPGAVDDLVVVHHIGSILAHIGPKCAEVARVNTDVGGVDVRVDVVIAEVPIAPLADQVGHRAQREEVVRVLQRQTIFEAQALAGLDFLADQLDSVCFARHGFPRPVSVPAIRAGTRFRNFSRD